MEDRYSVILSEWYEANPEIEKSLDYLLETPRRKSARNTPLGYEFKNDHSEPVEDALLIIVKILGECRWKRVRSLRDSVDHLNILLKEYDMKIHTAGGLSHIFTRIEVTLGITDKITSYDKQKMIRKERREKRQELGLKNLYHFTRSNQKKIDEQKKLTQINIELGRLKDKERRLKVNAARKAKNLGLKKNPTKYQEDNEGNLRYADSLSHYDTGSVPKKRKVGFEPTIKQLEFLSSNEDIVLYGGAAGGGKSYAMLIDPLRYCHIAEHNVILIRKTMPELNELIDESRRLYPMAFPGCKYRETDHVWTFPSGAKIRFGYLDKPADKFKYAGKAFTYIGFDEVSQQITDEGFNFLRSRLRRTNKEIQPYIRATANPGSQWVYDMFIKDHPPGKAFILPGTENNTRPITCKFIPAFLEDNPYLDDDGMYRAGLESLDDVLRRQLLEGDWLASNDSMFPEFRLDIHVCDPFFVPHHWNRVAGLDYGYVDPSAGVWFAINPDDGSIVIYDELCERGLTGREFALRINQREEDCLMTVDHPIDWSIFARTGHIGPSIAESMMSVPGFRMRRADKAREAGWVQIHELLRRDPETGAPKIQIFSSCKNLIRQIMGSKTHKIRAGDLDDARNSDGHWDMLDAFRYGVMSRPRRETYQDRQNFFKKKSSWEKVNDYFGQ